MNESGQAQQDRLSELPAAAAQPSHEAVQDAVSSAADPAEQLQEGHRVFAPGQGWVALSGAAPHGAAARAGTGCVAGAAGAGAWAARASPVTHTQRLSAAAWAQGSAACAAEEAAQMFSEEQQPQQGGLLHADDSKHQARLA